MKGTRDWVIVVMIALGAVVLAVSVLIGLLARH